MNSSADGLTRQWAGGTEVGNNRGVRAGGHGEGRTDGVRNQNGKNFV